MTEYGRGAGSQPWHPEDPLYGDQRWAGGQSATYQDGWDEYDPYGQQYGTAQQDFQQPYPPQQQPQQHPQQQYGWEGTQGAAYDPSYGMGATDPYGMPVVDGYSTGQQPDYYAAQRGGYPQQHPQQMGRQAAPVQDPHAYPQGAPGGPRPGADPDTGWDPGPDQGEHAFFSDREEEDGAWDEEPDDERASRGGRRNRKEDGGTGKRRSGCAIFVACAVLAGGIGSAGYFGYHLYNQYLAPPPDYQGKGSGEVQVEIPAGAVLADMGDILQRKGVVKSGRAFVAAAAKNKQANGIQQGVYTMRRKMSGASAVALMLNPTSQNNLIVREGLRAKAVYELIDSKLGLAKGTTQKAAKSGDLGLPGWAGNNPEGFLFPSRYSISAENKPQDVLREMVKRAEGEYTRVGLEARAKKVGKTPEQTLAVASLIQAEAQQDDEFGKVSRVIYNRLDQGMALGFDSTINYAKGRSTLDVTVGDTKFDSPYNTYLHKGLPPGPIDNPGHQAIEAALKPTEGNWLYFVTVKPGDTRFTASKAEHDRNVQDFNEEQKKARNPGGSKGSGG